MKFVIQLLLEVLFAGLLFFNVFVSKSFDTTICIVALIIFLILNVLIRNFRKPITRNKKDALVIVSGLSVILLGIIYCIGYKTGYTLNYTCVFKHYISVWTFIKVLLIVILSEATRYIIVNSEYRNKKMNYIVQGLFLVILFLIELNIAKKAYDISKLNQFYELFALVFVQSISKNLLLNYLTKKYAYMPGLIYRLVMDLYIYLIPISPKINSFIEGVILLVAPYIVFIILRTVDGRLTAKEKKESKKHKVLRGWKKHVSRICSVLVTIIFVIIVVLVSREFKYAMIAIGSESMSGTYNKGDAVIYKKIDSKDKLDINDVIVYEKEDVIIIHRIVKTYHIDGKTIYQTKGDSNDSMDNWIVETDAILGKVVSHIPIIAWPSVLINEVF